MNKASKIIKKQAMVIGFILESSLKGIIGFIAAYFFKPLWDKITKLWTKK